MYVYDKNRKLIGRFEDNTFYDTYGKVVGHREGEYIVDRYNYGNILYRCHDDGYITKGTSKEIVGRITDDGYILEGTSKNIIGKIEGGGFGIGVPSSGERGGTGALVVATIVAVLAIFFSIFMLPGELWEIGEDLVKREDFKQLTAMLVCIAVPVIIGIIKYCSMKKKRKSFGNSVIETYQVMYITGLIITFLLVLIFDELSAIMLLGIIIVPALIAVLPTLLVAIILEIIYAFRV